MTDDRMFGPLVVFGLGGTATEVPADHAARLTPLTDTDADALIRSVRAAPLLLGTAAGRPGERCATCCCGSPGSPTTCPRSPSSTSTRSSPSRTACSPWTRGSRSPRARRRTLSCAAALTGPRAEPVRSEVRTLVPDGGDPLHYGPPRRADRLGQSIVGLTWRLRWQAARPGGTRSRRHRPEPAWYVPELEHLHDLRGEPGPDRGHGRHLRRRAAAAVPPGAAGRGRPRPR